MCGVNKYYAKLYSLVKDLYTNIMGLAQLIILS